VVVQLALLALLAAFAPSPAAVAATPSAVVAVNAAEQPGPWVGTWEAAQVRAAKIGPSETGFTDQTVRDVVHLSVGGMDLRIRISDVFGTGPLHINDVRVALSAGGARTMPGTSRQVTFDGKYQVTIPAGYREFSDPVHMRVRNGQSLAISIFFRHASGPATWHPAAITKSYYSTPGNHSAATSGADFPYSVGAWYFLDGVDVVNPSVYGAVVTLGPSTTDGIGSTVGANERYPDDLARHLLGLAAGLRLSVLNAGISGNQLLTNGTTSGQSALERFNRDVLEQSGVRVVIVWEGTNDIGDHADMRASRLIAGYLRLIAEAHARGVAVVGATLQPDEGARYYSVHGNEVREQVNRWIRTGGAFDGVADFDAVLRDPASALELRPAYDSGDHLHPNDAGYLAIADSINPWALADLALGEWL
jgi:lysophospholipase L1-like esterase